MISASTVKPNLFISNELKKETMKITDKRL